MIDISNMVVVTDEEMALKLKEFDEIDKQKRYEKSGVGHRYLKLTLEDFEQDTDEQKRAYDKTLEFISAVNRKEFKTLWFCGNSGTGKTMLSCLIVRECGGRFTKSYQIANEIEDSKSFSRSESKMDIIDRYAKASLLVIDEVGKFENKNEVEFLFQILNERYEREKPTVIVTNKSKSELKEYLGKPLFDRFIENCTAVEFSGNSYRLFNRQKTVD